MTTRSNAGVHKRKFFSTVTTLTIPEPSSYTVAVKIPEWKQAMCDEFDALKSQKTWSLVPHTPLMNIVDCKWVFPTKYNHDGSVTRYKAHLVAKGYNQVDGIYFDETYSPVVEKTTVRIRLTLAAHLNGIYII